MLLAVNFGNTHTVIAVFLDTTLLFHARIATDPRRTADEYAALLYSLFQLDGIDFTDISGVIVCSVVPSADISLRKMARDRWRLEPVLVSADLDLGIKIRYHPAERLGTDRIATAVGAMARMRCPAIIVDLGTATTIDALSAENVFLGGAIAPGLELSARALAQHTAQIPLVEFAAPATVIGTDTVTSLQSGLIYGHAALVDGLVARFRDELGQSTPVIATGGLAGAIIPHTRSVRQIVPNLTLEGLRIIYDRNGPNA